MDPTSLTFTTEGAPADTLLPGRDLFQVARYFTPTEAFLVRNCLIAAGIPAVVADDQLMQVESLWALALGGTRVLVPQEHMQDARAIIAAFERGDLALRDDDDLGSAPPDGI